MRKKCCFKLWVVIFSLLNGSLQVEDILICETVSAVCMCCFQKNGAMGIKRKRRGRKKKAIMARHNCMHSLYDPGPRRRLQCSSFSGDVTSHVCHSIQALAIFCLCVCVYAVPQMLVCMEWLHATSLWLILFFASSLILKSSPDLF